MHIYLWQIDHPPIEHRCLEYHYTKLATSNCRSIYIKNNAHIPMADWTPSNWAQMPWILLHQTWHISWQIYIYIEQCTLADWPPIWNCHWQQIKYWLINVCSESPFKTVIFITALHCIKLYMLSFGVQLLDR